MKRDMELIRELLLAIESDCKEDGLLSYQLTPENTWEQRASICYNLKPMQDAGFIEAEQLMPDIFIKQQPRKLTNQARETTRECINRESHYLWGKRYLLNIIEKDAPPNLEFKHSRMFLQARPGTDRFKKNEVLDETYRDALQAAIPPLIAK